MTMLAPPVPRKAVIVGQGYVGLPLAMAAVQAGFGVLGIDVDEVRIAQISRGESPVNDVTSQEIESAMLAEKFSVSSDYLNCSGFSHAFITVPTPLKDGKPDLSFIEAAGMSLAPFVSPGSTIVLESTTYPGTTEELLVPILERGSGLSAGSDFHVGYSPERIDPGNADWGLLNTPKVVSGIDDESLVAVRHFYESLGISTVPVTGTREAELTKLLENTFRHVNIALVNELSLFASALGVDIRQAIDAASTKPFGFMKFIPGPGVGGHCLPVDPSYLSWAVTETSGEKFRFVELANSVNSRMPGFVVDKAVNLLTQQGVAIHGSKVLLAGLAYKPDTSDTRESPSLAIAELLSEKGIEVFAADAHVPDYNWPTGIRRLTAEVDAAFPLGILVTNHSETNDLDLIGRCAIVLDTRNVISGPNVRYL